MTLKKVAKAIKIRVIRLSDRIIFFLSYLHQILCLLKCGKIKRRFPCQGQYQWGALEGSLFIPGNIWSLNRLCLQKIDLCSGSLKRQIFKGNGHGHSVVYSKKGKGWLIPENGNFIFEFDLQTLRQTNIIFSPGKIMGGHGACSPDGDRLYFIDRSCDRRNPEGNLLVYDINHRKIIQKYEGVGVFPHDIQITRDEKMAVIASYGFANSFIGFSLPTASGQSRPFRKPSFTVVDLQHQEVRSKHTLEESFLLTHLELDEDKEFIYFQGADAILWRECSHQAIDSVIKQRGVPLTAEEKMNRLVCLPAVHLKVDLRDMRIIKQINLGFYRSQSILLLKRSGLICETFGISNKVVLFDQQTLENKMQIDFSGLDLTDPRGLAFSGDERFLFVSGRNKNIYCFDLCSAKPFPSALLRSDNYTNSHISIIGGEN
jgi:hypothetical protein